MITMKYNTIIARFTNTGEAVECLRNYSARSKQIPWKQICVQLSDAMAINSLGSRAEDLGGKSTLQNVWRAFKSSLCHTAVNKVSRFNP